MEKKSFSAVSVVKVGLLHKNEGGRERDGERVLEILPSCQPHRVTSEKRERERGADREREGQTERERERERVNYLVF